MIFILLFNIYFFPIKYLKKVVSATSSNFFIIDTSMLYYQFLLLVFLSLIPYFSFSNENHHVMSPLLTVSFTATNAPSNPLSFSFFPFSRSSPYPTKNNPSHATNKKQLISPFLFPISSEPKSVLQPQATYPLLIGTLSQHPIPLASSKDIIFSNNIDSTKHSSSCCFMFEKREKEKRRGWTA